MTKKLEKIMRNESATIDKFGRELAMNFDIPARDIISMACCELRISRKEWDAIQSFRCAHQEVA
jgi:hypothetical protein